MMDLFGCTDINACNYNSDATIDNGSCEYSNEEYDCDGNCLINIDCFGFLGGDSIVEEC